MESDEDYELLNEGTAMSELDFSDNQGDNTDPVMTKVATPVLLWQEQEPA